MTKQDGQRPQSPAKGTLSENVYLRLRQRILRGEWLPSTRLTLRSLAQDLGTSVQPVRDAIGKLTVEGALILRPNHAVLLPHIDKRMLDEVFSIRNLLEGEAARMCASRLSQSDLEDLALVIHSTKQVYTRGARAAEGVPLIQSVAIFIAERCGSSTLAEKIVNLRVRTAPFYALALQRDTGKDREFVAFTVRIQIEFLNALRRGDGNAAAELRRADLYTFQHHIYRLIGLED